MSLFSVNYPASTILAWAKKKACMYNTLSTVCSTKSQSKMPNHSGYQSSVIQYIFIQNKTHLPSVPPKYPTDLVLFRFSPPEENLMTEDLDADYLYASFFFS